MKKQRLAVGLSEVLVCLLVLGIVIAFIAITLRKPSADTELVIQPPPLSDGPGVKLRIEIKRIGIVKDDLAYGNRRGIYIIIDHDREIEYIGVSGIGITEVGSHSSGKTTVQDER